MSRRFEDMSKKLKWKCSKGHTWEARGNDISQDHWCPDCGNERKKCTIEQMQQLAAQRGGTCLSKKYINHSTKLKWKCAKGHIWETKPNLIRSGHWCPECSDCAKGTIDKMQQLAAKKGGKCLSRKYINSKTKLKWKCAHAHIWLAIPNKIQQGRWCPECARLSSRIGTIKS